MTTTPPDTPAADDLLAQWELWQRARNHSDRTITERVALIRRLPHADSLTPAQIDEFLVNPRWRKATRATYHRAIRAWSQWLIRTGHRTDDPTLIATSPRVPKGRPRPLADGHVRLLLETPTHPNTHVMILLAAYAGLRVGEIANVRGSDVDRHSKTLDVVGKGSKRRTVPLHPLLVDITATMPATTWWFPSWTGNRRGDPGGPVLANSISACISRHMRRCDVPGTPHALRHWFGSSLRAHGADSLVIKELMGHESMASTAIYVDESSQCRTVVFA